MGCMRPKADPRPLVGRWMAFGVCSSGTNRRLQASCCDGVVWRRMLYMAICRMYEAQDFALLHQSTPATVTDSVLLDVNAVQNGVEDFVPSTHLSSLPESRQKLTSAENASAPACPVTAKVPSLCTLRTTSSSAVSRDGLLSLPQYCMYMTWLPYSPNGLCVAIRQGIQIRFSHAQDAPSIIPINNIGTLAPTGRLHVPHRGKR